MPGLPRKSTVNQFKKLMKKSGKAKTNKASGGVDPTSRKIATYEQYFAMKENAHNDVDPYGEEEWDDVNINEKLNEIHDWLSIRLTGILADEKEDKLNYELLKYEEAPLSVELLEDRGEDGLSENDEFFYGLYFNDLGNCWVNWRCLSDDRYGTHLRSEYNINLYGDEYKNRAFDDFKRVIKSIIYHKNPPQKNIFGFYPLKLSKTRNGGPR